MRLTRDGENGQASATAATAALGFKRFHGHQKCAALHFANNFVT
jgi:hypothetical protein